MLKKLSWAFASSVVVALIAACGASGHDEDLDDPGPGTTTGATPTPRPGLNDPAEPSPTPNPGASVPGSDDSTVAQGCSAVLTQVDRIVGGKSQKFLKGKVLATCLNEKNTMAYLYLKMGNESNGIELVSKGAPCSAGDGDYDIMCPFDVGAVVSKAGSVLVEFMIISSTWNRDAFQAKIEVRAPIP